MRQHTRSSECKDRKGQASLRPLYPKLAADIVPKLPTSTSEINSSEIIFQISDTDFKSSDTFEQSVLEGGDSLIFSDPSAPLLDSLPAGEPVENEPDQPVDPSSLLAANSYDNQRIVVLNQKGVEDALAAGIEAVA